jgi:hypothetical protein
MTKFDNRTTTATAAVMNFEAMSFELVTVEIPYTRTLTKAAELVAAKLNVPVNTVSVKELAQKEFRANDVSASAILNIAHHSNIATEEEARELANDKECTVPYNIYEYAATVFGYSRERDEMNAPKPFAKRVLIRDTVKRGKNDAKAFIANDESVKADFETIVYLEYKNRFEVKRYAIVDSEEYQKLRYNA